MWAGTDQIAQLAPSTLFQLSPAWRLENNHSAFQHETWTTLVNGSLSETAPARQKQLYAQLNDFILVQSFSVPVATYPNTFLMKANVKGTEFLLMNGGLSFTNTWLA